MKKKFEITYEDPDTLKDVIITAEFSDTPTATAEFWAEDYAYSLADKGYHKVREIK